ncbi:MAG: 30S ribosomal protein S1 [Chlamydiae bacterium]|nr:30S ribosomal protein S1 [Chlamydiota bacterium]MBI3265972.1 30S ribosomal protein S1 [Chlamydiota bacterium]
MGKPQNEEKKVDMVNTEEKEQLIGGEDFKKLYESTFKDLEEEKIVKGTVIDIRNKEVLVDIGYKSEGLIPLEEFRSGGIPKLGDVIEVYLEAKENDEGVVVLSKQKADKVLGWERIMASCKEGQTVDGRVCKKVKGGLMVDIGMEAFLPASQIDVKPLRDISLDQYLGKVYTFKVIKINLERRNVILSRRELLEEHRKEGRSKLLEQIKVGEVRKGIVKNVTDFGAFVDLNGIDGLLHITDMSWGRINHPSEILSVGNEVQVLILDFDKEKERVSLGLKQLQPSPWDKAEERYPVGKKVKGRVVNIVPYGGFIELEKGIEGLLHISELSWIKRINHPSEILKLDDEIEAVVLEIDPTNKKLSLGVKQTELNPWNVIAQKYPQGTRVKGLIRNLVAYGAFMEIEPGIDGLIHISDLSWTRKINHPSEVLKKGDEVEAVVLSVDAENKKVSLSVKELKEDPWVHLPEQYKPGEIIEGKVTKVTGFGAFVELEGGIEGLIHISQLTRRDFKKIEDVVKEGEGVKAIILRVEQAERRIALSMKDLEEMGASSKKSKA